MESRWFSGGQGTVWRAERRKMLPSFSLEFFPPLGTPSFGSAELCGELPSCWVGSCLHHLTGLLPRVLQWQLLGMGRVQQPAHTITRFGTAVYAQQLNRQNFPFCSCALPPTTCLSALSMQSSSVASYSVGHWYSHAVISSCQWRKWKAFAEKAREWPGAFPICLATEMCIFCLFFVLLFFFEQVSISSPVLCFFSFCLSFYSFLLSSFLLPGPRADIQDSEMTQ